MAQVLVWADEHRARTGTWPNVDVTDQASLPAGERWRNIDRALRDGYRGLEGGSSLARLLQAERGVRNPKDLPPLTEKTVLAWARAHRRRTGKWPNDNAGPVVGTHGETWQNIDAALKQGTRGLPGGDSLARLLARGLGVRTRAALPRLTEASSCAGPTRTTPGRVPGRG